MRRVALTAVVLLILVAPVLLASLRPADPAATTGQGVDGTADASPPSADAPGVAPRGQQPRHVATADPSDAAHALEEPPPEVHETKPGDGPVRWTEPRRFSVVDARDGTAIEGARVMSRGANSAGFRDVEVDVRRGVTGADGGVQVPVSHYWPSLVVSCPGYQTWTDGDLSQRHALPDVIQLEPGRRVRGRVVLGGTDAAISSARVFVWDVEGDREVHAEEVPGHRWELAGVPVEADGSFELPGVAPDHTILVAARAPSLGFVIRQFEPGAIPERLTLTLGRGATIEGVVRDGNGTPVVGAEVFAVADPEDLSLRHVDRSVSAWDGELSLHAFARTDQDGGYRITGLPAPDTFVVTAKTSEFARGRSRAIRVVEGAKVDLSLVAPAWPTIRAFDGDGNPVGIDGVNLLTPDGREPEDPLFGGSSSYKAGSNERSLHTRRPGRYLLVVTPAGSWRTERREVELRPGRQTIDVVVEPGHTARGVVVDRAGSPVARARVVYEHLGERRTDETDADGRFSIEGLPAGRVDLRVGGRDDETEPGTTSTVLPTTGELTITLPEPATASDE